MKRSISILLVFGNVLFFSCDRMPKDSKWIYMINNSDQEVVYYMSGSYPDTTDFALSGCTAMDDKVNPGERKYIVLFGSWESVINEIPSKTLMFFVYNVDSVKAATKNATSCKSLASRKDLILKRFDVTVDYLNKNNWELIYP